MSILGAGGGAADPASANSVDVMMVTPDEETYEGVASSHWGS
jgi:hypothetical protein